MSIDLPKDLIKIIEQIVIYEDMLKEEEIDNFQYEYAYIEDIIDDKREENSTVIQISL